MFYKQVWAFVVSMVFSVSLNTALANGIKEKTLISWCTLDNLTQRGGSILTIDRGDGSVFDGIVLAKN